MDSGISFTSKNNTEETSASVLRVENDLTFEVIRSDEVKSRRKVNNECKIKT